MTRQIDRASGDGPTGTASGLDRHGISAAALAALPERSSANDRRLQYASPSVFLWGARAHIFKPARSAMSSGMANTRQWTLRFEPRRPSIPEPLMGWCSGLDTLQQVELHFPSREAAIAYAMRQGLAFEVSEPTRLVEPSRPADVLNALAAPGETEDRTPPAPANDRTGISRRAA